VQIPHRRCEHHDVAGRLGIAKNEFAHELQRNLGLLPNRSLWPPPE
jgi:hypothetical protein